jgi:predicted RNase H-like nuclease (RuvC/YqgF family)
MSDKIVNRLCTCTNDKEATCIVHPTTQSLKEYIAKLEAENAALKEKFDGANNRLGDMTDKRNAIENKYYAEKEEKKDLAALREVNARYKLKTHLQQSYIALLEQEVVELEQQVEEI